MAGQPLDSAVSPLSPPAAVRLDVQGISKRFGAVTVLRDVSFTLKEGEILGIIGENGAGKSTLMKILSGIEQADSGRIALDDRPLSLHSPADALKAGVALVHQELNLIGSLTISDNIFLGRESHRFGILRQKDQDELTAELLAQFGLTLAPDTCASDLSPAESQLVEIARAVSLQSRVIILDEPTTSLTHFEARRLFAVMERLAKGGSSLIFISHRLDEVARLCHRVIGLRDGVPSGEVNRREFSRDRFIQLMIGRTFDQFFPPRLPARRLEEAQTPAIEVTDLSTTRYPDHSISFSARRGEIVGIAGLVGAGRTEVLEALAGVTQPAAGSIALHGRPVTFATPRDALRAGVALVPEDRRKHGVHTGMSVADNISLTSLFKRTAGGLVRNRTERQLVERTARRFTVKCGSLDLPVGFLSGGNQQKVVLAKYLLSEPTVLLLDEPTRGVDIGARQELYQIIRELAADGVAVVWISSELEELFGMANRILVLREGSLTGELDAKEATEETVMHLAARHV